MEQGDPASMDTCLSNSTSSDDNEDGPLQWSGIED